MASHSESNIVRILLTTDNHLGYMERDPKRGEDSFLSFEECLAAGRLEHNVDLVLLGGDLFHDNKPSLSTMNRSLSLFRKYVLGDKPVHLSLLSDPGQNFPTHPLPIANFQDPNLNVALPVFMIHGNHDDPVGGTSAIDILSSSGLVNYFGHVSDLDDIIVRPVLIQKGKTKIALYGMGNVRDERLHRCFKLGKVRFVRPKAEKDGWFSILVLHQNRGVRGGLHAKAGIPEEMIAPYKFDVIIWGNEHEQRMVPEPIVGAPNTEIIQPGSTIMTSLTPNECNPKQYGVLMVCGTDYKLDPHPLRSARPVVRRSVTLARENPGKSLDQVEDFLRSVAENMIEEAQEQVLAIPDDVLKAHPNLKFPLMRLAVDFSDHASTGSVSYPQPNANRFGQEFLDIIVNPGDFLKPIKPLAAPKTVAPGVGAGPNQNGTDSTAAAAAIQKNLVSTNDIRGKIAEVFNANAKDACSMLSEPEVSSAVYAFVEKSERSAIEEKIDRLVTDTQRHIWKNVRAQAASALDQQGGGGGGGGAGAKVDVGELDVAASTIMELALGKKNELNEEYYSHLQEERGMHGGTNGLEDQYGNDPVMQELLGIEPAVAGGGNRIPLGAPLPATGGAAAAKKAGGGGGGVVNVDDEDGDDDALPSAMDIIAQHQQPTETPKAPAAGGRKKAPASAKSKAKASTAKRNRDADGTDDMEVLVLDDDGNAIDMRPPPPAPKAKAVRGKKAAAAPANDGPQLQFNAGGAPPPGPAPSAVGNLLSKWGGK